MRPKAFSFPLPNHVVDRDAGRISVRSWARLRYLRLINGMNVKEFRPHSIDDGGKIAPQAGR
jgi:hypothetical protein